MNIKYYISVWFVLFLGIGASIPVFNLVTDSEADVASLSGGLFSSDSLESDIALRLYQKQISASPHQIIVGKQGWLFLSNFHEHILDKIRGANEFTLKWISEDAEDLSANINWLQSQGIQTVFAIVPTKHRIYSEFLPDWIQIGVDPYLRLLTEQVNSDEQLVINFESELLAQKPTGTLYELTDSHWNNRGALLGYDIIMRELNATATNDYVAVAPAFSNYTRERGDLLDLLKIDSTTPSLHYASERFAPFDSIICIEELPMTNLTPTGDCREGPNTATEIIDKAVYSNNATAANQARVLILRDSFGAANSQLFQESFSQLWQVHHRDLFGLALREFVLTQKPDIVIYQVAERLMEASYLKRRIDAE